MAVPNLLTRAQQMENAAFLRHLRRTGNASTAARALGFTRGRFTWRRPGIRRSRCDGTPRSRSRMRRSRASGRRAVTSSGEPRFAVSGAADGNCAAPRPA